MPYIAWYSLFMILAGLTLPRTSSTPISPVTCTVRLTLLSAYSLFYYHLFWFILFAASTAFIFLHGTEFVAWPRLLPPTDVLMYTGPGYRARYKGKTIGVPVLDAKKAKWMTQGHRRAESKAEELEMGNLRKRTD
jgi:phosphatidylinositol 4-phosphatase